MSIKFSITHKYCETHKRYPRNSKTQPFNLFLKNLLQFWGHTATLFKFFLNDYRWKVHITLCKNNILEVSMAYHMVSQMPNNRCRIMNFEFRIQNSDFWIFNSDFQILNPKSCIPNPDILLIIQLFGRFFLVLPGIRGW